MERSNVEKKRINLYMPKPMLDDLDQIADELGANRTSLINMICRQYLDQRQVVAMSKQLEVLESLEAHLKAGSQG